ncbi:MAG: hypothetical protein ACI8QZ_000420 [Chlamydiales bacterium]|jgi:hypothetical protein
MLKRTPRWILLGLLTTCGCATEPKTAPVLDNGKSADVAPAKRPAWLLGRAPWPSEEGVGVESNGGRYWVVYVPPEPEIPLNEEFDLELRVFDAATRSWLVNAEIALDARMPAHGHGMKIEPTPVQNAEGGFDVPGMLLHMVGHWELYVDLTEGAVTERAQFDIELE